MISRQQPMAMINTAAAFHLRAKPRVKLEVQEGTAPPQESGPHWKQLKRDVVCLPPSPIKYSGVKILNSLNNLYLNVNIVINSFSQFPQFVTRM
ncbi:hypothetical protein TNCV_4074751 [Trichonephila clavipes]|nr:hypothetical protein TNCV_4074751 [Trichonephila clavipes]